MFVFMGLGILFLGMSLMSQSMEPLRSWPVFLNLMQQVQHPLLGLLVGALVTALLQSSSVSVGIIQMLAASGLVGMQGALYLVLGAKIGACTPSLLAPYRWGRLCMVAMVHRPSGNCTYTGWMVQEVLPKERFMIWVSRQEAGWLSA